MVPTLLTSISMRCSPSSGLRAVCDAKAPDVEVCQHRPAVPGRGSRRPHVQAEAVFAHAGRAEYHVGKLRQLHGPGFKRRGPAHLFFSASGSRHCSEPTRGRAKGMHLKLRVLLGSAVLFGTPGTVVARGPAGPPASRGGRAATPDRNKRLTNKTSGKKYARMDRSSVVSQLIHPLTQELLVEKNNRARNWPDTAPKCHPWS